MALNPPSPLDLARLLAARIVPVTLLPGRWRLPALVALALLTQGCAPRGDDVPDSRSAVCAWVRSAPVPDTADGLRECDRQVGLHQDDPVSGTPENELYLRRKAALRNAISALRRSLDEGQRPPGLQPGQLESERSALGAARTALLQSCPD